MKFFKGLRPLEPLLQQARAERDLGEMCVRAKSHYRSTCSVKFRICETRGSHQSPERYPFRHRFAMTPPPVGEAAFLFEGRYVPVARCPAADRTGR